MRYLALTRATLLGLYAGLLVGCARNPLAPGEVGTPEQVRDALARHGMNVSLGTRTLPSENRYFAVSSRDIRVDGAPLIKVFEYESATLADKDAALVSPNGQPNPK